MPTLDDLRPRQFVIPRKYIKEANDFLSLYDMEQYIPCPPIKYGFLKQKKDRICRFCGKTNLETSFKTDAHLFPEMLGNRYLLSDFECDNCNSIMSKYENHLANFLGIARAINGVSGKNKNPKYKSLQSTLSVQANSEGKRITIIRESADDKSISYDSTSENILVKFSCNPYVPLYVYKSLLKIALSVLPEQYIEEYKSAFQYLISDTLDDYLLGPKMIFLSLIPLTYIAKFPIGMLFKKRNANDATFTHYFCLYFQNFIFQTIIPLNKNDLHLYDKRAITISACPILCPDTRTANVVNEFDIPTYPIDLSSKELKKDDERTIEMPLDRKTIDDWANSYFGENSSIKIDLNNIVEFQISRS